MPMKLRVAACQILTWPDVKASTDKVCEWLKIAAKDKVDVVAFPEASLCGYQCAEEYWKSAVPEEFAVAEKRIIEASRELNIAIVLGTVHWVTTGVGSL